MAAQIKIGAHNKKCSTPNPGVETLTTDTNPAPQENGKYIPKVVFQTWKSRDIFPRNYMVWSQTFKTHNPGYQHIIWADADNRRFISNKFPWFLPIYDGYPKEIYRADIIRLFFLLEHGGIYADMDSECLRPLDDLIESNSLILARMGQDLDFEHSIPNAMMASRPGHIFWALAIALAAERYEASELQGTQKSGPELMTGPILIKDTYDFYTGHTIEDVKLKIASILKQEINANNLATDEVTLLSSDQWYPIDWTNFAHRALRSQLNQRRILLNQDAAREMFPNATLITYWGHSW